MCIKGLIRFLAQNCLGFRLCLQVLSDGGEHREVPQAKNLLVELPDQGIFEGQDRRHALRRRPHEVFHFLRGEICLLLGSFGQAGDFFGGLVWAAWESRRTFFTNLIASVFVVAGAIWLQASQVNLRACVRCVR